jgi:hypothetical protein
MARTQIATDNFNRASLGADWANLNAGWGSVSIESSTVAYSSGAWVIGSQEAVARWVGAGTFTDDQYASCVILETPYQSVDYYCGVCVRASADTDGSRDYYGAIVQFDRASSPYPTVLFKVVNGTYTSLYNATYAWAVNDRIELEVEGTELRVCKNGTPLGGSWTTTDASLSTGKPGIIVSGSTAVSADDWEGGNITSAATAVKRSLLLGIG